MEDDHSVMQLIYGDGKFNAVGLDNFVKKVKLAECGISYAVVSIMGPQSSGKSTLLNHLFHTKFREMNAVEGRSQTTQGIWLAECVGIKPFTIVMDLEGNDGKERGQDIAFEKQAALFALAISDILMINMHCTDIGRENAANKPLLRTVFEVMLQSMGTRRQTTLMFIIRDLGKTPLEMLRRGLLKDIRKIWDEVPKPLTRTFTQFDDTFRVVVAGLPHYEYQNEKFQEEVAHLRQRFFNSTDEGGLAGGGRETTTVVPAREFSSTSQEMWKVVKENQNLNLPELKVMISTVRCEAIANDKVVRLRQNQTWLNLEELVKIEPVQGFSKQLSSIIDTYLSEYDDEVQYFEDEIRQTKRKEVLERKALEVVYPAYKNMLEHLRRKVFQTFKDGFIDDMGQLKKKKIKDELFESVWYGSKAAISQFDKESKEYLVVIPNKERKLMHFVPDQLRSVVHFVPDQLRRVVPDQLRSVVPFGKESSGVTWDASKVRTELQDDLELHSTTVFKQLFMDNNAKTEDAEKAYKEGWAEWLKRVLEIVASAFHIWVGQP